MSNVNEYSVLTTEGNNEKSKNIDKMSALEIVTVIGVNYIDIKTEDKSYYKNNRQKNIKKY